MSGTWLDGDLKMTQKDTCLKEIERCAQNMFLSILSSIVNKIWRGGPIPPLNKHMNLHSNIEYNIYTSFGNYKAYDYGHNFDFLPNHFALIAM